MISVLVIDDYPATVACVRRALMGMFECVVVTASNARDAISALETIKFDLIVSDYDLGDTCGSQVLDYLRSSQPDRVEHFVFFTGSDQAALDHHHKVISKGDAGRFADSLAALIQGVPLPIPALTATTEEST